MPGFGYMENTINGSNTPLSIKTPFNKNNTSNWFKRQFDSFKLKIKIHSDRLIKIFNHTSDFQNHIILNPCIISSLKSASYFNIALTT